MERILTDPELGSSKTIEMHSAQSKNIKIHFLEKENEDLKQRKTDLETSLQLNKQIIRSLLEGQTDQDCKRSFEAF